ncbi:MAG: hypothetical protein WBE76_04955 [Terracidiphilus sp.]
MADKRGIDNLVLNLERICLEHYAMKSLLRDENPHSWQNDVFRFYLGSVRDTAIRGRFDELYALLRSNPIDTKLTESIVAALEPTNLEAEIHWVNPPGGTVNW